MNSYLFTQKKGECEDPRGKVQNNTERGRQRETNIDTGEKKRKTKIGKEREKEKENEKR